MQGFSTMLILIPTLLFSVSNPVSFSWTNLCQKISSCPFWLKIGTMICWRCWFQIQTYVFEIPIPKSIFGQIWAQKFKVVSFVWKLVDTVFKMLIPNLDLDFWNFDAKIHFWANLSPKIQSSPSLSENWITQYLKDADSKSGLRFLKIWP